MTTNPFVDLPAPESPAKGLSGYVLPMGKRDTPFGLIIFDVEPGASTESHSHEIHEYWLITSGCGTLVYEGKEHEIKEGNLLYIEPNKSHQVINTSKNLLKIVSLDWYGKAQED